jgi:predicted kinase
MAKVCFVMVGVSGSGKSTTISRIKKIAGDGLHMVFSLDNCRIRFLMSKTGMVSDLDDEKSIYEMAFQHANDNQKEFDAFVNELWAKCLAADILFVDNMNLTRKSRARWIQDARSKKFAIWGVEMMTPLDTILSRQSTRTDKTVPESMVRDMYMRQQSLMVGDEVDFLVVVDGSKDRTATERYPVPG